MPMTVLQHAKYTARGIRLRKFRMSLNSTLLATIRQLSVSRGFGSLPAWRMSQRTRSFPWAEFYTNFII